MRILKDRTPFNCSYFAFKSRNYSELNLSPMRETNTVRLDDGLEATGKTDGSNFFFFKFHLTVLSLLQER